MSIILYQFKENYECSTQINIINPFSSTVEGESFLDLDFGVSYETFFDKLTSLKDSQKYDIILKHKNPAENFIFPADFFYPNIGQKKYRLLFNNAIKPRQYYSSSVNHVTTPISIMFSRFGINENCAEFLPNHFVSNIQDSRKFLVKRHSSYDSYPTPIKKLPNTSIEKASSLSVLESEANNTSYVNSKLSNPSGSKISTGSKFKPSILTIKKSSQFTCQKN